MIVSQGMLYHPFLLFCKFDTEYSLDFSVLGFSFTYLRNTEQQNDESVEWKSVFD